VKFANKIPINIYFAKNVSRETFHFLTLKNICRKNKNKKLRPLIYKFMQYIYNCYRKTINA